MGTVFAAEFLAEVGEMSRFNSANDLLAAAAGLAPVLRSIGFGQLPAEAETGKQDLKATVVPLGLLRDLPPWS